MDTYAPRQPRIRNPDSYTNFLVKIYATNLAKLTVFDLICRLLRLAKMDHKCLLLLQNYLKQVLPPSYGRSTQQNDMLPTLTLDRFDSTWQFLSIGTKKKSRNEEKASGITTYEPSKLYNPSDTFVALEESSADAGFFQAEICRTFGRIFVYKRTLEIAYLILSFIKRSYVLFLSKYKY